MYTLHTMAHNSRQKTMICSVYFLLPDKSQDTYRKMLQMLQAKVQITCLVSLSVLISSISDTFLSQNFQTDFERAAINAFKQVYPNANGRGCFFHWTQCIWKKVSYQLNI